jgi:hypothetical protein
LRAAQTPCGQVFASAGLWKQKRNGSEYRSRRTSRSRFGELVQFDDGRHEWFEGRWRSCCLMAMVKIRPPLFSTEEAVCGALAPVKTRTEGCGAHGSPYRDGKSAFALAATPAGTGLPRLRSLKSPQPLGEPDFSC